MNELKKGDAQDEDKRQEGELCRASPMAAAGTSRPLST